MTNELQEQLVMRTAIVKHRCGELALAVDSLIERIADCKTLIAAGTIDYQHAFETMIEPQAKRILIAKDRLLEVSPR